MKKDPAEHFSNPRMLAAIYFGLLSVVGTILINAFLNTLGIQEIIPLYQSIFLGMAVASGTGALFGERLICSHKPYKRTAFWIGFTMVMASLPVFVLGLVLLMDESNTVFFSLEKTQGMVLFYLKVLGYSYLLYGFFLAIAAGLAAMYLRAQLVYDLLYSDEQHQPKTKLITTKVKRKVTQKPHSTHR